MAARKAPLLVDLCIKAAINNVRYLGDVGDTELDLLQPILTICTVDQLMHVEKSSVGRDLSPVTDNLWRQFFEQKFGFVTTNVLMERMRKKNVSFKWIEMYEGKLNAIDRVKELYEEENSRKTSRWVQLCTKIPPSGKKRGFCGSSGHGYKYNLSKERSNLMKKAKMDFLNCREVKNIEAMRKIALQKNYGVSPTMKIFPSTFKRTKRLGKRF